MTTLGDGVPKAAGTWDYYGSCDPLGRNMQTWGSMVTFSVGVFQWVTKSNPQYTKKGKVVKRFSGRVSDPRYVYDLAMMFISTQEAK
jgi:hypothetical protein